jgi:hypothetical protein
VKHSDEKKLSRKLSALELVGPLICVAANFKYCKGQAVCIWVDNAGSVKIWEKGYSTSCELCNTLVQAIADIAACAGCQLHIQKIRRCSTEGAIIADALSKAEFQTLWQARDSWGLPTWRRSRRRYYTGWQTLAATTTWAARFCAIYERLS